MTKDDASKDVLLDGARMSFSAFIAGTLGFLKRHDIPAKDWTAYIGDKFAEMLGGLEGRGAGEVMQHLLALDIQPWGAEVLSSKLTDEKAEVTLTTLPSSTVLEKFGTTPQELLEGFGINQEEFETIYAMFEPAAESIKMRFTHKLETGKQVLGLEKYADLA